LLVFKRDEQNLPKDKGTYILNKEEIVLADQIENKGATISKENASELRGILDKLQALFKRMAGTPEEEEPKESAPDTKKIEDQKMKEEMEALRKELEEKNKSLTELQARVEDQAKSIEAFKKKEDELKQKEMERSWESVKATLPPGLTHKEESEKELKELYFNKPHEFIAKVSVIKPQKETSPEGEEHAFKENAISAGRTVGYFDMNKKEYVR
jgi:predicted RNase H-like nuclease (RuvC/YqgF family)